MGPGELAHGGKYIGFDSTGLLYVADNNVRWSIFTRDLAFVGHVSAAGTGVALGGSGFILGDGRLLSSGASEVRSRGSAFGVFDALVLRDSASGAPRAARTARLARAFGTDNPGSVDVLTPGAGDSFWTGNRSRSGNGYELHLWSLDGVHLRTIRRDVEWLPRLAAREDARSGPGGAGVPPPELEVFHYDGTGVIIVGWMVPVPNAGRWESLRSVSDRDRRRAQQEAMISIYVEAIDTEAGIVLASMGPLRPSAARVSLPAGFLPRSRVGYRREETPDGVQTIRIVQMRLIGRQ